MAEGITVFVRPGDRVCADLQAWLDARGHQYTTRDVAADPAAAAALQGRLGRVAVPAMFVGDRLVVGFDPVQLARLLPGHDESGPPVSFGAAVRTLTPALAKQAGLPAPFGVEVGRVVDNSVAAAAGIEAGDIITDIGAYTLHGGAEQFGHAVAARRPGDRMTLTVWRSGERHQISVLFPSPDEDSAAPDGAN